MAKVLKASKRGRGDGYLVDGSPGGRRRWKKVRTHKEAKRLALEWANQELRGSSQAGPTGYAATVTVADYAQVWLQQKVAKWKPRTIRTNQDLVKLRVLPRFGRVQVRAVTDTMVRAWLADLAATGLSRDSCRVARAVLAGMMKAARRDKVIVQNPTQDTTDALPREADPAHTKALTEDEVERFLAAFTGTDAGYSPMFTVLARTGLRLGELLGLKWQDVDLARGELRVTRALDQSGRHEGSPKSKRSIRTVPLSPQAVAAFRVQRGDRIPQQDDRVFTTGTGQAFNQSFVRKVMARALDRAGLPSYFSPHCLRHTFGSQLTQNGDPLQYIQQVMGHSTIALTMKVYGSWLAPKSSAGGGTDWTGRQRPARRSPRWPPCWPPHWPRRARMGGPVAFP